MTKNDNIRVFSAAFQILLRKEYPVYLLMTGLYENIYNLQNEKSLTFLYRAPKVVLEPLNYTAMIAKYKQVFSCEQEKAEEMATSHKTDVTLIREALGMSTSKFSVYRDRLKRKGIVNASQYGSLFLILPRFEDFIKLHLE